MALSASPGLQVVMLITLAEAFLPNSVTCGPRSTSTRSTSWSSLHASPARACTTPSMTKASDGSAAIEKLIVPTPRRKTELSSPVCEAFRLSAGTSSRSASTVPSPRLSIAAPLTKVMAAAVSCRFSARLVAVTMLSLSCGAAGAGGDLGVGRLGQGKRAGHAARPRPRCGNGRWRQPAPAGLRPARAPAPHATGRGRRGERPRPAPG